jgi:outer membrane lipoprotein SlyB
MKRIAMAMVFSMALSLVGCASYYKVTDVSSGKTYYTDEIKRKNSSVMFKDAQTQNEVTLQNSEVIEISKDQFKAVSEKD